LLRLSGKCDVTLAWTSDLSALYAGEELVPRTLSLAVALPASATRLYGMYLDPKQHAAFTGAPVQIAAQPGARFSAFDGALSGTILQVVPNRLIVQSWRSTHFAKRDLDSTLVLSFWPKGRAAQIEITHVNIADSDFAGVSEGWSKYYWVPWRAYLKRK
jgi:activator of HSP90 ATPase